MLRHPALRPLVLASLAMALVGTGCWSAADGPDPDEGGRSARVGETFVARLPGDIEGRPSTFVLPDRRYQLIVSSPQEALDTATAREEGIDDRAAAGTRFVAVAWDRGAAGGDALVLAGDGPQVSPRVSLVVDGDPVEVGALDEEGVFARWVVVPTDARRIGVAVEYDGLTQTDEDASSDLDRAEGGPDLLAAVDGADLHSPECPEPVEGPEPARYAIGGCHVTVTDPIPYHRSLGWAERDRGWIVVALRVDPVVVGWDEPGQGGAVVGYEVAPEDVEVTLDGAGPVEVLPSEPDQPAGLQDDGSWSGEAVFSVAADVTDVEVVFARPFTGLPEDPDEARAEGTPAELAGTYEASFPVEVG